jgi:hypothetical protein
MVLPVIPYWHRWLFGILVPSINIVIGLVCIRRAKGNVLGPLLVMYGAGIAAEGMRITFPLELIPFFLIFGGAFAWIGYIYFVLLFPTGTFYPPRWRIFPIGLLVYISIFMVIWLLGIPQFALGPNTNPYFYKNVWYQPAVGSFVEPLFQPLVSLTWPLFIIYLPLSLILRYRGSSPAIRQQMKWLLWGVLIEMVLLLISNILQFFKISDIFGTLSTFIVFLLPPIAVGNAILRHRLYDIDIIIRRTVIYSILTTILAIVYFGGIILLQRIFQNITGQNSELAIVASTLLIVAMFTPLRRRVQDTIDRRFYRRKYNAEQTIAKFNETLRDEVDLETLKANLVNVVQETLEPSSIRIWIKEPSQK